MATATYLWSGYGFAERDGAFFSIYNNETSTPTNHLYVEAIRVIPITPFTAASGNVLLKRITAHSGGIDVPALAMDSSNTLSASVTIKMFADVTQDTEVVRSHLLHPQAIDSGAIAGYHTGDMTGSYRGTGVFYQSSFSSDVQDLVLAAGEGFAIKAGTPTNPAYSNSYYANITFNVSTATYFVNCAINSAVDGISSFSIMNETGSGISVNIKKIEVYQTGPGLQTTAASNTPYTRICFIADCDSGQTQTPVSLGGSATPSFLDLRRGLPWSPLTVNPRGLGSTGVSYDDFGYPSSNQALVRKFGTMRNLLPNYASQTSVTVPFTVYQPDAPQLGITQRGDENLQGYTLKPQQGMALIQSNPSIWAIYWIEIIFRSETVDTVSSNIFILNE